MKVKLLAYIEEANSEKEAKSQGEKIEIKYVKYVFPNACETNMVFKINTISFI